MDDAAAFSATYEDWKLVKSRGVVQIIFEAPVEKDNEILRVLGGMPRVARGQWFAIARLNIDGAEAKKPSTHNTDSLETIANEKANGRSLAQRAAISCNDPQFRLFLEQWPSTKQMLPRGCHVNTGEAAAMVVRTFCRVDSRSEIIAGTEAGDRWENLHSQFVVWKHANRYVEAPRIQQENQA